MSELPAGWRLATLGDVATVTMGQSPPGSSYNTDGIGQPFFQGKAEFGETHPTVAKWTTSGTKFAHPGDILMSVRAPVGPTNVADIDCVIGRGLAAIAADSTVVSQRYLIWVIKHLEAGIASQGKGSTFDSISGADLRGTLVPVPPLDEQKRIVEILEEQLSRLDAGVRSLEILQNKIHSYKRSLLLAAFSGRLDEYSSPTNNVIPFSEAFSLLPDGGKKLKKRDYEESGVPVIDQGEDFISGYTSKVELAQIIESPVILFGDHTRRIKAVDFDFVVGADGIKILVPADFIDFKFAHYYLLATELRDKGYARHFSELSKCKFDIPTMKEQKRIVSILNQHMGAMEDLSFTVSNQLKHASRARRALLNAAFTGQLTKEPADV